MPAAEPLGAPQRRGWRLGRPLWARRRLLLGGRPTAAAPAAGYNQAAARWYGLGSLRLASRACPWPMGACPRAEQGP